MPEITVDAILEDLTELPYQGTEPQDEARRWQMLAEALVSTEPVMPIVRAYLHVTGRAN